MICLEKRDAAFHLRVFRYAPDHAVFSAAVNKNADETKCTTTGNILAFARCQITGSSYRAGDEISWGLINCDGKSNVFKDMEGWDQWRLLGDPNWIKLYADTHNCYLSGRIFLTDYCIDNGQENTRFDFSASNLFISSLVTEG